MSKRWIGVAAVAVAIFLVAMKVLPSIQPAPTRVIRRPNPPPAPTSISEPDSEHIAVLRLPNALGKFVEVEDPEEVFPILVDPDSSAMSKSLARLSRAIENHPGRSTKEVMRFVHNRTGATAGCEIEWRDEAPVLLFRHVHGETLQQSIERCAETVEGNGRPGK